MTALPAPVTATTCEHCDAELAHRRVPLDLDGRHFTFCSDRCERRYLIDQVVRQRRYLNRIYVTTTGRVAKIAKTALHTNLPA